MSSGCGGVGLLYRKNLEVTQIAGILSDRICGVRVQLPPPTQRVISIFGVYLPCSDQGMECYREHLVELEQLICESQHQGPVLIAGDFNAHLGSLGGPRGLGQPNQQGLLFKDLIDRCSLHVLSLSERSEGPAYTFWNSTSETTVDYIIGDVEAASLMSLCYIHPQAPLNTSDHLPVSTILNLAMPAETPSSPSLSCPKVNWVLAQGSADCLIAYQDCVTAIVTPLVGKCYESVESLNDEIIEVANLISLASLETLPLLKPAKRRVQWFKDKVLARLAAVKKAAWDRWKAGGCPISGPLFEEKIHSRKEFRKRLSSCHAAVERRRIQKFDNNFKVNHPSRFKFPKKKGQQGSTLFVNGVLSSDHGTVMNAWSNHFKCLSASHDEEYPILDSFRKSVEDLSSQSWENDDEMILDVPFTLEEVEGAVRGLKRGKAGGCDNLQPEHICFGGASLSLWLQQVYNAIIEFEAIPAAFKLGVVSPVYKGQGKDPLCTNSYRGITITSVLAKVLERLFLGRLQPILSEQGIPHLNQTGFVKGSSCSDAIFSTYEVLSRFAREGDTAYVCFFDLQKAFDTVQYPVLLKRAFDCGINGKAWRLLKSWYTSPGCMVKVDGKVSQPFCLERGVLQGSVLSPTLFLLIIDPLLRDLACRSLGPNIRGLYAGAFAHADDIRTVSTSRDTMDQQIQTVECFAESNALSINASKCEVVVVSSSKPPSHSVCSISGHPLAPSSSAKCLGYWWSWDLSADKAIAEAVGKARRAFFAYGAMGAFHGKLNPLSGRAIYETCVIPVLLYGSENWFLTDALLQKLESFQAEIGRRILTLSTFHSARAVRLALDWPSVASRVLERKLLFLLRMCSNKNVISHHFLTKLNCSDSSASPLQLLEGCVFLESHILPGAGGSYRKGGESRDWL